MAGGRLVGLVLLIAGILAIAFGSFSYTKDETEAKLGPLKVEIQDGLVTDRVVSDLMGKDASARFQFIMEGAAQADDLDV